MRYKTAAAAPQAPARGAQNEPAQPAETREWSDYQQAIFAFMSTGKGSGIVYGVAGCAKTTTLEEGTRRMAAMSGEQGDFGYRPIDMSDEPQPAAGRIKYLVFNKKNAVEAQERMPDNVDASTFHSSCYSALMRRLGRGVKVTPYKTSDLIKLGVELGMIGYEEASAWAGDLAKLVGLAKNAGIGCLVPDSEDEWWKLISHYDIDFDDIGEGDATQRAVEIARMLLEKSNRTLDVIDFDDQLYLTVLLNVSLPRYDVVLVDEAQDTNAIQRAVLRKMLTPGTGRLIAVGDPRQSIYGFRGASTDAMSLIEKEFGCERLPLSVNYRCSKAVIEEAKGYCPEIQAWDGAPEGSVTVARSEDQVRLSDFAPGDAILCRVNAPIVTLAYKFIGNGQACTVLGRDIGQGLVKLVRKLSGSGKSRAAREGKGLDEVIERLGEYEVREVGNALAKGLEGKAIAIQDKCASLRAAIDALPENQRSVESLVAWIERLFSDEKDEKAKATGQNRVTLSTVHKAKGLEWNKVWILDRSRMPSKWARQAWQIEQEENLIYVATTRAKVDLVMVESKQIEEAEEGR